MVHIWQDDGKEVAVPKLKDQGNCEAPVIAADKQTVGWLVDYDVGGQSYPIALTLVVYRTDGTRQFSCGDGLVIWTWHFWSDGSQVACSWGPSHGEIGGYSLFSVRSGRLLKKIDADTKNGSDTECQQALPDWAAGLRVGECE